jgi:hypothetical protein
MGKEGYGRIRYFGADPQAALAKRLSEKEESAESGDRTDTGSLGKDNADACHETDSDTYTANYLGSGGYRILAAFPIGNPGRSRTARCDYFTAVSGTRYTRTIQS